MEQRVNVRFCDKLQKWQIETLEMLKSVYGECTMSKNSGYIWRKDFREGREGVNLLCAAVQ
jgi:hypothetical protein